MRLSWTLAVVLAASPAVAIDPPTDLRRTDAHGACDLASPTVVSVGAQEATFEARAPRATSEVWWEARHGATELWTHRSTQQSYLTGETMRFGASGLAADSLNEVRYRVGQEWSCPAAVRTTGWSVGGPLPPGPQLVEDHFDRPNTTLPSTGGDGLGPAWFEEWTDDEGVSIFESNARSTPTCPMNYLGGEAQSLDTWADAKVRCKPSTGSIRYNFRIVSRVTETDVFIQPGVGAYLIFGPRGCLEPTLAIFQSPDECFSCAGGCVPPQQEAPPEAYLVMPSGTGKCDETPPLDRPDGATHSEPVWLRIEVTESNLATATVAWECPDDQPLDDCAHVCQVSRQLSIGAPVPGSWGMGFHDKWYEVMEFRAGSAP